MKTLRETIKYFGDVFNLEITNEFTILDIKEELEMQPINRLINDYKKSVDNE